MWGNQSESLGNDSGGFLNDTTNSSGGEKGTLKRGKNIIPVMISHILNSSGDLEIWGISVHTLTFIGIVRHIEKATTKTTYEIEDETGKITAFRWLEAEKNAVDPTFELNTYVRVYGHLREQNEKKHVLVLKILPVTDLNELTNHLLEVTHITLKARHMKNKEGIEGSKANDLEKDFVMDDNVSGLTKDQATVFRIIQAENESENGIERDTLKSKVPRNILSRVDEIIDFLTSEGHIYTTLTEDHFKTT